MNDITAELNAEYRIVEKQVRENYRDVFDQIEQELLEKWQVIWRELGFDVSKLKLSVSPRITVSIQEEKAPLETQEEESIV